MRTIEVTEDEYKECVEWIKKMRAEREKEVAYNSHLQQFADLTMATIDAIGVAQTKQIVRQINQQLRGVSTD